MSFDKEWEERLEKMNVIWQKVRYKKMTNEQAIATLKRIQEPEAWEPQINQAAYEALDMAIKALEQQSDGWLAV